MTNDFLCVGQYPAAGRKAKTKRNNKMPPGSRNIKRVRAGEQPIAQTQRRTSKRLNRSEIDVHNEEQHEDGHGDTTPNLSTPGLTDHDSISVEEDMASNAQELGTGSNEHPLQQTEGKYKLIGHSYMTSLFLSCKNLMT
jgi:hypothetical protein